jgi:hypothetical protein
VRKSLFVVQNVFLALCAAGQTVEGFRDGVTTEMGGIHICIALGLFVLSGKSNA